MLCKYKKYKGIHQRKFHASVSNLSVKAVAGVRTGLETGSNLSTDPGMGKVWRMLEHGGGQASGLPQGCIVRRQELRSGGDGDH